MSTKTLKQRIALVAVSALTAGVLSLASSPIANATAGDVTANTLWLASTNSGTGAPIVTALGGDTAADKNTGYVAITSTTGTVQGIGTGLASGAVGTASMLPTGSLVFNTRGGAVTDAVSLNVSGGTIASESVAVIATSNVTRTVTTGSTLVAATAHGFSVGQLVKVTSAALADTGIYAITVVNDADSFTFISDIKTAVTSTAQVGSVRSVTYSDRTSVVRNPGGTPTLAAAVSPTGAVGTTMTVSAYKGASVTASTPTNGTLLGQWVITIVASGTSGVFSAANSNVSTQLQRAKGVVCSGTATFDDVSSIANNATACIHVNPKDAYGVAVTTGNITASATNNAKVLVSAANAAAGYLAAAPFSSTTSAADLYVTVIQATAGVGQSTVVTITWNGVVIGTKTITFQGDIAKLTLLTTGATASNTVYLNGATNTAPASAVGKIFYSATDALGTAVTLATAPSISDATGAMTPAVLDVGSGSNAIGTIQSAATGFGFATMTIATNPLVGAGTYRLKVTNAAGTDIKTDVINATVSGGTSTFTASWDKASYSPGETATLTISGKDSGGRPVAQGTAITGGVLTVNTAGFTSQTCPADISTTTFNKADGSRVCTFAALNTAGAYSFSMALTNSSGQSAVTGALKIVDSSGTVTNAEVLKSIVALIASINKQIQALQKLILKR